jgi:signal transduction histidine kinase
VKQNQLFSRSRWQLASWYAGISSIILSICGLGVYIAISHAHQITIEQELESVAGTLHDSLLPILQKSGKLEPEVNDILPNVCLVETGCYELDRFKAYRLGVIQQGNYYLRLFNVSRQLVAVAGIQNQIPEKVPESASQQKWSTVTDAEGIRYQQISLLLHTQNGRDWGYLVVGRSLADFDRYVANAIWIILLGVPLIVLLVMVASWWLAGLAIRPIYQSYRQIQQFTADAAHELRTPLAAIQATIQANLMLAQLTEITARDTLSKVLRQNKRLSYLVADLLTLCRLDGELITKTSSQIEGERIAVTELIIEVTEDLAALAIANEIELTHQVEVPQPIQVKGDHPQLYRLLTNLVTNAIQYTPAGEKVVITLTEEHHQAVISVRDTGIGIAKSDQRCVFDRFYRVDKARSRSEGGAGLGLSIARAIAISHRGSIELKSEIGQGSSFILRIPRFG